MSDVYWYARCRGVARMGTFKTQLEAWEAVIGLDGTPAPEATVWCESKEENRGWKQALRRQFKSEGR